MPFRKAVLSLAVLLLTTVPLALAQGTYTQIDYPGAVYTECVGINTAGDITGLYTDTSGIIHGFLLSGGTYTTIDYPGSNVTLLLGINDVGQIVGFTDNCCGFLYDITTQAFTGISYPGANLTGPYAISDSGTIVGYFQSDYIGAHGFELIGSTYTEIQPPGDQYDFQVFGITGRGALVGVASFNENYWVSPVGEYHRFSIPLAEASVAGVNRTGTAMVGVYFPNSGNFASGFVTRKKSLTILNFPDATDTYSQNINDAGKVVGTFYPQGGTYPHGFTWTPPADAAKK